MNLDANVQKLLFALLKHWKLIIVCALIGAVAGFFYTSHFTTLTYTSSVKFLSYATDGNDDVYSTTTGNEVIRSSNTSKMNYAMHMLPTYIEVMKTNEFYENLAADMNETYNANYSSGDVSGVMEITSITDTAMFDIKVTTEDADLSYRIAKQLETTVPKYMKTKNQGLVRASVEDRAIKATSAGSLGYARKCAVSTVIGIIIAAAYIILRTLLDVRIRSTEELTDKYSIPVLGTIPDFESRGIQSVSVKGVEGYVKKK